MKRIVLLMFMLLAVAPAFGVDDDSTPYMPYPETPPKEQAAPKKKPAPKKKAAPKKQAASKKAAPKKAAPKRKAPARSSSLLKAIALMQQERYAQAKPYLLKAIQENRNDPNAWYWYGVYHEKTGGFHQAQYFYSKAVTIDPTFEPLSRVVFYPEDPEKTPLWDPKRPARVYPVEVANTGGLTTVPAGRSSFPTAPNDPELPRVPVYTPPEPGASPFDGDAWSPAVYVPPGPDEIQTEGEISPVYVPPEPESVIAQAPVRQVLEVPMYDYPDYYETEYDLPTHDGIIRADKPLYNPPKPGEKAPAVPRQSSSQTVKKKADAKVTQPSSTQRKASVPDNRIVRQTQKPKRTTAKPAATKAAQPRRQQTPSRRTQPASQDVRPRSTQQQPTRAPEPVTLPPEPEVRQERQQAPQYYPPVGQQAPDPGTIPENPNLPPVGQGSQY